MIRIVGFLMVLITMSWSMTIYDGIQGQDVVNVLHKLGYSARLTTDSGGDPKVITKMEGVTNYIYFYACHGSKGNKTCKSIEFYVPFATPLSAQKASKWNATRRFSDSYTAKDGHARLEGDIETAGGITQANLVHMIGLWDDNLSAFLKFINW